MQKEIKLITNGRCPRCDQFGRYLKSEGIEFSKLLIEDIDPSHFTHLRALPIFKLGGEYIQYTNQRDTFKEIKNYLNE